MVKNRRCFGCGKEVLDRNGTPKELVFIFFKNPAYVLLGINSKDLQCAKVYYDCGNELYCVKCYKEGDLKTILENINTGDSKNEKS